MSSIPEKLLKIKWLKEWHNPKVLDFIRTGDPKLLKQLPGMNSSLWALHDVLPAPSAWTAEAGHLLQIAIAQSLRDLVTGWLDRYCRYSTDKWPEFPGALEVLRQAGVDESWIEFCLAHASLFDYQTLEPSPAGLLMLEYDDARLTAIFGENRNAAATVLARRQPDRLDKLLAGAWRKEAGSLHWTWLVKANPDRYHKAGRAAYKAKDEDASRLAAALAAARPEPYRDWAVGEILKVCRSGRESYVVRDAVECLLELNPPETEEVVNHWMAHVTDQDSWNAPHQRELILKIYRERFPERVRPAMEAMARSNSPVVVAAGLKLLKGEGYAGGNPEIQQAIRGMITGTDPKYVIHGLKEAAVEPAVFAPDIWPLMEHKSAPVRSAAARTLSGMGFTTVEDKAVKLLNAKKADVRLAAVTLIQRAGGPEALALLKDRLDVEEADNVRDAILLALDAAGVLAADPGELAARMAKTLAKTKGSPAKWLAPEKLRLVRRDGTVLTPDEVLYLLVRQSRCSAMRADLEARPLFASLDRAACAPAASAILEGFLASSQDNGDRWTIAFAALCGDDRLLPPLHKAILTWADNARGKLAEFAAGALALLGTDSALTVLESLTVRFRSKNKNIGEAAGEAFAAAAEARGVSVEELGDIVVPWLGFEPGARRVLQSGNAAWEMWIGPDLKPVYKDQATGKKLSKLPASAGAAILEEQKILAANLKEVAKAQLLRMETLLVRQFHWPVSRWRALYPVHPVLRVFTSQLIWRLHPAKGPEVTFRSLGDGGFTSADDAAFTLSDEGTVSLLHPLDLTPEEKDAWETNLQEYHILPPFPQLRRPVFTCPEDEREAKFLKTVADTELNAMTFRGRAEKLGWVRSSACDGGMVSAYRKVFSGTGVEAFLSLDGMFVGIGVEETITLGEACFVNAGAVKVGSYVYDEPSGEDDARLIPHGAVPAVAYSEVMADLYKISGKEQNAADAPAA